MPIKERTDKEQHNNKCNNVLLTHNGLTMNMSQWAKKLGISRARLWDRINRNLSEAQIFSVDKLSSKVRINTKFKKLYGVKCREIAELIGISEPYVYVILSGRFIPKKEGITKEQILKRINHFKHGNSIENPILRA